MGVWAPKIVGERGGGGGGGGGHQKKFSGHTQKKFSGRIYKHSTKFFPPWQKIFSVFSQLMKQTFF
jgi:hypothetical protein